jgi:hypothetical protein
LSAGDLKSESLKKVRVISQRTRRRIILRAFEPNGKFHV